MIPELGRYCDLCTPPVHYLLTCPTCEHQWDEPSVPGDFTCPNCGTDDVVTPGAHGIWAQFANPREETESEPH